MTNTDEISKCLIEGGVALLPTDTVYGLATLATNPDGVRKIFELKSRPGTHQLPVMVSCIDDLKNFGADLHESAMRLLKSKFVPGDLTLILGFKDKPLLAWLEGRSEFAVRIPNHENLLEILRKTGPLLVTSANKHGVSSTPNNIEEILTQLNGKPDIVSDGGIVENIPSTIVNCRTNPPVIERTGRISYEELIKIIENE